MSYVRSDQRFVQLPFGLLQEPGVTPYYIAVYAALRSFADFGKETGARASDKAVAKRSGCSERAVREARNWLRDKGWLSWESGKSLGVPNSYLVHSIKRGSAPHAEGSAPHAEGGLHDTPTTYNPNLEPVPNNDVCQIFDYWKQQSGHSKARLTDKRTKVILARRKRFSTDELKTALRSACQDDFYKDGGYDWLETILKNDEAVERHIDRASNGKKPGRKRDPLAEFVEAQVRASQGI